ncbi:UTRA domain-containing protein [Chimaeribacter californicus]|uniref:UTRA domain-containing protein n=1 Tax=Chimaeribacter californicus TaxID=2060067 RepID=UPI0019D44A96|nr:UTRA domain-containing protein [Chimaeribacter californicus]
MVKKPRYREIADTIRQQVTSGQLKAGDALPTEAQLGEHYGVSRVTVRQALKVLTDQQVIASIQGSGRYVRQPQAAPLLSPAVPQTLAVPHAQKLQAVAESAGENVAGTPAEQTPEPEAPLERERAPESRTVPPSPSGIYYEVLDFAVVQPDETVRTALRLKSGERVYHVRRRQFIRQRPAAFDELWMPLALFPDLSYAAMQSSTYDYVEQVKHGVIDRSEQELRARMPSVEVAQALGIDRQQPVLEQRTVGFLQDGTVFEYSCRVTRGDDVPLTWVTYRHDQAGGVSSPACGWPSSSR